MVYIICWLPQVILLMFTENVNKEMRIEMMELFSGHGTVSGHFRQEGVSTVSYDIDLAKGRRTMDFLSEAGFALKPQLFRSFPPFC